MTAKMVHLQILNFNVSRKLKRQYKNKKCKTKQYINRPGCFSMMFAHSEHSNQLYKFNIFINLFLLYKYRKTIQKLEKQIYSY